MHFSERLRVPGWWWLLLALMIGSVALAVFAYLPSWVATTITLSIATALGLGLIGYGRLRITADADGLKAGTAKIEWRWIGGVEVLDQGAFAAQLNDPANHPAHLVVRPYAPHGVRISIDDSADPHPAWLVSSRHPQQLAAAIDDHVHGTAEVEDLP